MTLGNGTVPSGRRDSQLSPHPGEHIAERHSIVFAVFLFSLEATIRTMSIYRIRENLCIRPPQSSRPHLQPSPALTARRSSTLGRMAMGVSVTSGKKTVVLF